ncbi:hypothetical protein CHUAL_002243 [Chamberlinius hualienensis]
MEAEVSLINSNLIIRPESIPASKSPVTIQDWINSIEFSQSKGEESVCHNNNTETEDGLNLGDEAQHFQPSPSQSQTEMDSKLQEVLATLSYDPEEVLLNLGLGDYSNDPLIRIPERFLRDSKINGEMLENFIKKQYELCELIDAGHGGYRGLSGYSTDCPRFSGIVLKCLQRIRDATRNLERALTPPTLTVTQPSCTMTFFRAVYSVLAINTFRNSIQKDTSSTQSILEPENKAFLDNQSRPRRHKRGKLILEKNSVALDADEDVFSDGTDELCGETSENANSPQTSDQVFANASSVWERVRKAKSNLKNIKIVESEDATESTNPNIHNKKIQRFQRQMSLDEEDSQSDQESFIQPKIKVKKPKSLLKCSSDNKDSFELEELSLIDDESNACGFERGQFLRSTGDVLRMESAVSDSSGYLEGEMMDLSTNMNLDDLSTGFKPIMESLGSLQDVGEQHLDSDSVDNQPYNDSVDDNNPDKIADEVIVKHSRFDEDLLKHKAHDEPMSSLTELYQNSSKFHRGISASASDLSQHEIYLSPFSRRKWLKNCSGSLQNLYERDGDFNRPPSNIDFSLTSWRDHHELSRTSSADSLLEVQQFRSRCSSVIDQMHQLLHFYTSQLKFMERMCWDSYHSIFPGTSVAERKELEKLSELRRLILLESITTNEFLNKKANKAVKRSASFIEATDVSEKMKDLVQQQNQLMVHLKQSTNSNVTIGHNSNKSICSNDYQQTSMEQAVAKDKKELLQDIRQLIKSDNETFMTQLLATRQEIENLKSMWTKFLVSAETSKKHQ